MQIELRHNLNDYLFIKTVLKILSFMSILSFTSVKFALPPLPPGDLRHVEQAFYFVRPNAKNSKISRGRLPAPPRIENPLILLSDH